MEAAVQPTASESSPDAPEAGTDALSASQPGQTAAGESTTDSDERDEQGRYLSREAASYRRRLRDAEQERDQLRERLDRVQRSEVERLASNAGLAVAGDVWLHGASLETLRGEDGSIDPETVSGLVDALVKDRPGLRAVQIGSARLGEGASARPPRPPRVGLSQLLKP